VKTRKAEHTLNPDKPITVGSLVLPDFYYEFRIQDEMTLRKSLSTIQQVSEKFSTISKRNYGIIESTGLKDAEAAVICLGGTVGTAKVVANQLKKEGVDIAVIKPWVYRPFPTDELLKSLQNIKSISVLDRTLSPGAPYSPLGTDVASTLFKSDKRIGFNNVVYGLGGRDIAPNEMEKIMRKTVENIQQKKIEKSANYIGVRE
jgi:pyruvate ferredoxin oxidoreductase alpha subunit